MRPDYFIGLDLGQVSDFTALAVVERRLAESEPEEVGYSLRHLRRWPLGTPYTEIVPAVTALAGGAALRGSPLLVDQTGVGRALVDLLRRSSVAGRVVPVTITGGQAITITEEASFHVPKKELVTCLQLLLQGRQLKMARSLPDAGILVRELQDFQVRVTAAAHETFGAWGDGRHDDLVLAVALACWWAERGPHWGAGAFSSGGDSLVARAPEGVFHS